MIFEVGSLARRTSDGELVEILYKYNCVWVHYRVVSTGNVEVDMNVKHLSVLTPLEMLAECAE